MKNKLFPGITLQVSCLPNCEKEIAKIFWDCLIDYVLRFNAPIIKIPVKISICAVDSPLENDELGLTLFNDVDNRILVQVNDPFISHSDYNEYAMLMFVHVLCHEIVHVCQYLTGRKGIKIPNHSTNKNDEQERYFFDPEEIEARILESPYASYYGYRLL